MALKNSVWPGCGRKIRHKIAMFEHIKCFPETADCGKEKILIKVTIGTNKIQTGLKMTMKRPSVLDILKHLPRTNCKECGQAGCMAFATLATQGKQELSGCPYLSDDITKEYSEAFGKQKSFEQQQAESLVFVQEKLKDIDFDQVAESLGGKCVDEMLLVECLGRNFMLDKGGNLHSECHNNIWVQVPLISYVLNCKGIELSGKWVRFDELENVMSWSNFFTHRCEHVFRQVADEHTELFFNIIGLLGGKPVEQQFSSDYSIVIYPLPKVPFLLCYWREEGEFESTLRIYFDKSTSYNIDVDSIYALGRGIIEMIKKIILRHG